MENIKTATRNVFLDEHLPLAANGSASTGWFLSRPLDTAFYEQTTHHVAVAVDVFTGSCQVVPVTVLGAEAGEPIAVFGYSTPEAALQHLGYVVQGGQAALKPKTKRTPARTHLNTADIDRETGKSIGRRPACGQLNGTRTDRAQTHYTHDTAKVTCQRCVTTKLFAKAVADEFHAIDRKAWTDALENNKELLERLSKERALVIPDTGLVEFYMPDEEQARKYSEVVKTQDITEGASATGTFGIRADGSGIDVLDFAVEGGAQ